MYPHERSLVRLLADKPFAIIGVNSDKAGVAEKACETKNLTWSSFTNVQDDKKISDDWKITGWPTTFLIDKDGIIRYKGLRGDALDSAIEKLMAEMDIEVKLAGVDHEAEDKKAMEAFEKAKKATEVTGAETPSNAKDVAATDK